MYICLVISDYKTKKYLNKGFFNIVLINFVYYLKKYKYLKTIAFILLFYRKKIIVIINYLKYIKYFLLFLIKNFNYK